MKIESLTDEQISKFPEFVKKWTHIGLCTQPANRLEAEAGIRKAYELVGLKHPKIVWCDSPLSQALTRAIVIGLLKSDIKIGDSVGDIVRDSVRDSVGDSVWAIVRASVGASVWASVRASVWAIVRDSVGDIVGDIVWAIVRDSVGDIVWDSVRASVGASVGAIVRDSVRASVGDSVRDSVGDSVRDSCYGQHDANWLGFYDYFSQILNLEKETQKLLGLWQISKNAGWWLPHEKICWVSERHNVLKRDPQGRLHADGEMALQYPDGWGIWALHGVRVGEYLAKTPAHKLDIEFFKKEKNADIRAEFIRKYGIERMISLGKVMERWSKYSDEWFTASEYELINMGAIYGIEMAPHLKMKNLTTGIYHLEGVGPECRTIEQALQYRTGRKEINIRGIK